ncbi:LON peptidase N-terminal domain and RING finger protein 2-like isoform X2 [Zootermopsis nevadensis]|nr:LON peptidase N-terminal domain and RING finger protein 2-like isoform X2 [Zootermopsis nevadensis]XP_021937362.1 LON peptidase N-terminal domain and RING finger protein 2-like isoform X2 [Zootermopsis nevadensis]
MTTKPRRECCRRDMNSDPAYVVDLTIDSPMNHPIQHESLPQRRARMQRREGVPVIDDIIDISTPVKQKRVEESPRKSCRKKVEKKSSLVCGMCPVCMEDLEFVNPTPERQVMSTLCGHTYCRACIEQVLEKKEECPKCRNRQTVGDIHPLYM